MFHCFNAQEFMTRTTKLIALTVAIATIFNCSDNDEPEVVLEAVSSFVAIDHGNNESSADIYVSFRPPESEEQISGYQLILAKSGASSNIDVALVESLSSSQKVTINKTGAQIEQQITSVITDTDGDAIVNGQAYSVYIYAKPADENATGALSSSYPLQLEDAPYYEVKTFTTLPGMEAISYYEDGDYFMGPGPNNSLVKVDLSTKSHSVFATGLNTPYGGGFNHSNGKYYISNYGTGGVGTGEVWEFEQDGSRTLATNGLNGPTGVAVSSNGEIFVNNYTTSTISKIDTDGSLSTFSNNVSGLIQGPDGLVFAGGQLYCINFDNPKITKISSTGTVTLFASLPGQETGYIAYDGQDFFVASLSQKKIYKVDRNGQYEEIAGNGASLVKDGPAPLASFKNPNGIVTVRGVVYVTDDQSIRMVIRHE